MQRISVHQFMIVLAAVLLGTTFFPVAQIVAGEAGRAGWLAVIPGMSLGLPFLLLTLNLAGRYPGKNLLEITTQVLGKWIGKAIGLGFTMITTYFGSLLLRQIADTWERTVQPQVSEYIHLGGAVILVVILCWVGIEVYARFTEVVFPLVVLTLFITLGLSIPRFEWDQLQPLFERGLVSMVWAGLQIAPYTLEGALFLTGLISYLPSGKNDRKRLRNGAILALALVGILNTLVSLTEIMVFGPVETERLNYGILVLGSMVQVARTIAGVESLFMIIWLGANVIKITAFFYMSIWGLHHVFGIKKSIKWYVPLSIIYLVIGFMGPENIFLVQELKLMDNYVIISFAVGWISLVWGMDYLKRRWAK